MIYRLNKTNLKIDQVTDEEAGRVLTAFGWSKKLIRQMFTSKTMLSTAHHYYCRFEDPLDDMIENLKPTAPSPYGTRDIYAAIHNTEVKR